MTKRSLLFLFLMYVALLIGGCETGEMDVPQITGTINRRKSELVKYHESAKPRAARKVSIYKNVPRAWFPPERLEKGWKAIILHHSLTRTGNAASFDSFSPQNSPGR